MSKNSAVSVLSYAGRTTPLPDAQLCVAHNKVARHIVAVSHAFRRFSHCNGRSTFGPIFIYLHSCKNKYSHLEVSPNSKKSIFSCKLEFLLKSASEGILIELDLSCMFNSSHFTLIVQLIFPINSTQCYLSIFNQIQKLTHSKSILHPFLFYSFSKSIY